MSFLNAADLPWVEPPGHVGGFSQLIINPDNSESHHIDFRLSRYPGGGRVDRHVHEKAEHVYYVLSGNGVAELGDQRSELVAGSYFFVPPGIEHSVISTGPDDLVFVLATSPPDIPR
jgi:quercetin dioxygenase-like cupin family protein